LTRELLLHRAIRDASDLNGGSRDDEDPAGDPRSEADEQLVEVVVADQGRGIPESEQARIFERFYRVDAARSRETGGTGLGLAIVKHICANHGGEVTVWSEQGHGSTFTIRLPAAPTTPTDDAEAAVIPAGASQNPASNVRPREVTR